MVEQASQKQTFVNVIDGEERPSASGDVLDIVDPATGEVYATSPNSGDEDVDAAFTAAAKAFESQRWTTPSERQRMLLKFADLVEGSADELAEVESRTPASRSGSRTPRRCWSSSTRSASSPVPPGCSRGARRGSTCAATPRPYAVSPAARSPRSRRGTTPR